MKYIQEQLSELNRVIEVFADYMHKSKQLDLIYSDKFGYILLYDACTETDRQDLIPIVIDDAGELCDHVIMEMVNDVLRAGHVMNDLCDTTPQERKMIEDALEEYMAKIPEYRYLIAKQFEPLMNDYRNILIKQKRTIIW